LDTISIFICIRKSRLFLKKYCENLHYFYKTTYTVLQQIRGMKLCFTKKGVVDMLQSPVEFYRNVPKKECSECGQIIEEQAESYLMECDYCLSKRDE
jgi:hypothetical protein